jgi:carbon monoxide dehydrogenase subunit G
VLALLLLPLAALPPASAWHAVKQVDGVSVRTAPSETRAPWGMAEGVIDATPEQILAHLTAFEELVRFIPKLERVTVVSRGEGEAVVYFYLNLPWPIADRDYTARYRWQRDEGGVVTIAIELANQLGPAPGRAIRVGELRGVWSLTPAPGGRTRARYAAKTDFGGSLTRGMIDQTAWRQVLETVLGVRKALAGRRPPSRPAAPSARSSPAAPSAAR